MITRKEQQHAIDYAWEMCLSAGLPLLPEEKANIEVVDLGLSQLKRIGLMILTLQATHEMAAKLIAQYPWQASAQHRHPSVGDYVGKEETFRGMLGEPCLYLPGEPTPDPRARLPESRRPHYTVWHEIMLKPGVQVYSPPHQWHWFQAGPEGAVILSLSSRPSNYQDHYVDPDVDRRTVIRGDE